MTIIPTVFPLCIISLALAWSKIGESLVGWLIDVVDRRGPVSFVNVNFINVSFSYVSFINVIDRH